MPSEFVRERRRLFGLAYRLLGSAADAEDVVQDAFLRWHGADYAAIVAQGTWLTKVVTNLCLNQLTSARARQQQAVEPWLPEPVLTVDGTLGPLETFEQRESVSMALLRVMAGLTPTERAVFVLREAFGYDHREISELLELSEANCRQLHGRARQRLDDGRARFDIPDDHARRLTERFLAAARAGELAELEDVLAEDVLASMDGGGSARRRVHGRDDVGRHATNTFARFAATTEYAFTEVNGQPALLFLRGSALVGLTVFEIVGGRITGLRTVIDPAKLVFAQRQAYRLARP